jgi:hypothetical protein
VGYVKGKRIALNDRVTTVPGNQEFQVVEETFILSEDGETITRRYRYIDGSVRDCVYLWQR